MTEFIPICIYCNWPWNQDNKGLFIKGKYICATCEQKLIQSNCSQPEYQYYISGLKKIWRCFEA
ncbi:sigma factor G inhibitor Gin [Peptococcaceae bacterium 1198_IL3148]